MRWSTRRQCATREGGVLVSMTVSTGRKVDGSRTRTALRVSLAKDRTVKRLLHELISLGERAERRDFMRLALRLRSVLAEIGHEV